MSEAKHTKGEWVYEMGMHSKKHPESTFGFLIKGEGKKPPICSIGIYVREVGIIDPSSSFATPDVIKQHFTPEEAEANAKLISCAPELLFQLRQAQLILKVIDSKNPAIKQMETVIQKATT